MDADQRAAILTLPEETIARTEDVGSPEAIVRAMYEVISGPAEMDRERNWDRLRSLFLPGARFILVTWRGADGAGEEVLRAWDVEGFIEAAKGFYQESAFYEREVARRVERFGDIAHVFTTYESRVGSEESDPVARGINSVQVVRSGHRWWIAHLTWDLERADRPIPEAYLPEVR